MASEEVIEANKKPQPVFKNRSFQQKFRPISNTGKKRTWRSLKQVLAQERSLPWPATVKHCKCVVSVIKLLFPLAILHSYTVGGYSKNNKKYSPNILFATV